MVRTLNLCRFGADCRTESIKVICRIIYCTNGLRVRNFQVFPKVFRLFQAFFGFAAVFWQFLVLLCAVMLH